MLNILEYMYQSDFVKGFLVGILVLASLNVYILSEENELIIISEKNIKPELQITIKNNNADTLFVYKKR